MTSKIEQLKTYLAEIVDLAYISNLLGWDQETNMPPAGVKERGEQMATLARLIQLRMTSEELLRALEEAEAEVAGIDPDSNEARLIKVTRREVQKRLKVPSRYYEELSRASVEAYAAWKQAREQDQFDHFRPFLEWIVALRREYASYFAPYEHVYDPLLYEFEPGLKTKEVQQIFAELRPQQVALVRQITSRPQVDDSPLYQYFDPQKQWDFGVEVITKFGYDWTRGRQDKSAHPFTSSFGLNDVRITTRISEKNLTSGLFSTLHECGHALYDQGCDPALARTPLAGGSSLALHESQSRLWENLVGRSKPFWEHFYPRLQEYFPEQLGNVPLEAFYRGINKVQPSLIRVEADEATYNLHVMLRLEIEIQLMTGDLEVRHLPEVWNTHMQEYLGVTPSNNAEGVLQDVHWSHGYIGYFPTYALGNLISVQLWEAIHRDVPNLEEQIRRGEFAELLGWLREKIHRHGSKFEAPELVERVTGQAITPQPYIRYLRQKYGEVYGF
ncbi:MAG: carboxypeptidase M32 [Anaerolineales bacterium]|nr:carboxypeptidase M32 [Anaerolineales bacterium]MDW8445736.1 carboxypeptidase M32 [Anaerolineales bacterium]